MLWLLYALSAWLSIIDGLLSRCLLSSCHIVEAYAQAATTIGAGDDFLLHTLWVVDLQALLALWAGDEFLLYYHWIIFVSFGLPFHDNHLVVKLSPHNGMLFVVSILEYVLVHIFIEFLCGNLAITIIVGTTFQRTL